MDRLPKYYVEGSHEPMLEVEFVNKTGEDVREVF